MAGEPSDDNPDLLRILITTDNHLGYLEKDPVRGNDSLETFKEILKVAKESNVDFVLQGGDLFHENKPSRRVIHRTMELLRHHCMGDKPCAVEFRSDPTVNFLSSFPVVNYLDPNYNVGIPVFAIHGNHDDPTGDDLSAMDVLSVSGLINYFGKALNVESIKVSPILLQKGNTRLALYGLGSIRDQRLHEAFKRGKVVFERSLTDKGKWFNILVLHQNRAHHGASNFIPASYLPSFIDLVIWGHEHECRPEPEYFALTDDDPMEQENEDEEELNDGGFYIYQPGSSVATSLCEGEVSRKHIGILHIKGTDFKVEPISLCTTRPFIMETVSLSQTEIDCDDTRAILEYLAHKVSVMIDKVKLEQPSDKLPLVRLRVDYTGGYTVANYTRFGQQFVDRVANPRTILNWTRKRQPTTLGRRGAVNVDSGGDELPSKPETDTANVSDLLKDQLKQDRLTLLSGGSLIGALTEFVDKNENDAISCFVKSSLLQTQDLLKTTSFPENELEAQVEQLRERIMHRQEEATESTRLHLADIRSQRPDLPPAISDVDSDYSDGGQDMGTQQSTRTATRGRTRGGRGGGGGGEGKTRGRGKGSRGGGRGRGRGRGTTAAAATAGGNRAAVVGETSTTVTKTTAAKKKSSSKKRVFDYGDDSGDDSNIGLMLSRKRVSTTQYSDSVDLTQDDDDVEESNVFDISSPFSMYSASKRRKR